MDRERMTVSTTVSQLTTIETEIEQSFILESKPPNRVIVVFYEDPCFQGFENIHFDSKPKISSQPRSRGAYISMQKSTYEVTEPNGVLLIHTVKGDGVYLNPER